VIFLFFGPKNLINNEKYFCYFGLTIFLANPNPVARPRKSKNPKIDFPYSTQAIGEHVTVNP
jgi:hypothetical protein